MKVSLFDFDLPPDRIATQPVTPRDAARLLVVSPQGLDDRSIRDLPGLLKPGDLMVFNDTRVIPARLSGTRGEATVEITLHRSLGGARWRAFAKPAKRLKPGDRIEFAPGFAARVEAKLDTGEVELSLEASDWRQALHLHGTIPLPNYMRRKPQGSDFDNYQTVYAAKDGAVAAPTAGLHFTSGLLAALDDADIERAYVTLHVGAGTFQPVKVDDTADHRMHSEFAEISAETASAVNAAKAKGGRIVAVGTTALRVLETAARVHSCHSRQSCFEKGGNPVGQLQPFSGETELFIIPGYKFKAADILLTNFHLPCSTLFMLVCAFSGLQRMQEAYRHACESGYRFYSYGDACLLLR